MRKTVRKCRKST